MGNWRVHTVQFAYLNETGGRQKIHFLRTIEAVSVFCILDPLQILIPFNTQQ